MTTPPLLLIEAVVDDAERPALVAAFEQLCECLSASSGILWPVRLRFHGSIRVIDLADRPTVVIASLLPAIAQDDEPLSRTAQRWRQHFLSLVEGKVPAVFVCTVFRHVADGSTHRRLVGPPATAERVRRVNLLAAELSQDTGISVIDIDRVFAHFGARALKTDYRMSGPIAAEVAGYTIVSSILAIGIDDFIPPSVQERAKRFQGDLSEIGNLVRRRLGRGN